MRLSHFLLSATLAACSEPASTDNAKVAKPNTTPTAAVPDLTLRVTAIVDAGAWPDGTPLRAARVEVHNGLAVPVEYLGPHRADGAVVLSQPDVDYFVRRGDDWYEEFLTIADVIDTDPAKLTVEAGASAELMVALQPAMLAGADRDAPWRLCVRGSAVEWLVAGRCTPPFRPRDGSLLNAPAPPSPWVEHLAVHDRWSGLSGPEDVWVDVNAVYDEPPVEIKITSVRESSHGIAQATRAPSGYASDLRRERWSGGRRVDDRAVRDEPMAMSKVDRLAALVRKPPVPLAAYLDQVVDPAWLAAHARAAYATLPNRSPPCRPEAAALFGQRFADPAFVRAALVALFESSHTDDYPRVSIFVDFSDGTQRSLGSTRQQDFLLPWSTEAGDSWDPDIADTIAAVLPDDSPNRKRLLGRSREALFAEAVRGHIDNEAWEAACE